MKEAYERLIQRADNATTRRERHTVYRELQNAIRKEETSARTDVNVITAMKDAMRVLQRKPAERSADRKKWRQRLKAIVEAIAEILTNT